MPETPDGAYLLGGPRGGDKLVIPGLLQAVCFPVPLPDDYWVSLLSESLDPVNYQHIKTDVYNLLGVFKLYEYGGRS